MVFYAEKKSRGKIKKHSQILVANRRKLLKKLLRKLRRSWMLLEKESLLFRLKFWGTSFRYNLTGRSQFLRRSQNLQGFRFLKCINGVGIKERKRECRESKTKACTSYTLRNPMMMMMMMMMMAWMLIVMMMKRVIN